MENIKELLQELRCDIACIPRTEDNKEEIKNATQTLQKAWDLVSESDFLPCVSELVSFAEWYNEAYMNASDDPIERDQIDEYLNAR